MNRDETSDRIRLEKGLFSISVDGSRLKWKNQKRVIKTPLAKNAQNQLIKVPIVTMTPVPVIIAIR